MTSNRGIETRLLIDRMRERSIGKLTHLFVPRSAKFALLFLAGLLLVGPMAAASAAEDLTAEWEWSSPLSAGTEPWRFSVIAYGWAPQAPVTIKNDSTTVANLPEDFDKILDSLEFAAMGEMEIHKGPFGVFFSPIYYKGDDKEGFNGPLGANRSVKIEESVWLIDYGVTYDLGLLRIGEGPDSPTVILQPYAGGRYLHDNFKMDLDAGAIDPGLRIRETLEFNTPIVGLDTIWDFTERWRFRFGGDYGGFNVDDVNETYQIFGALGYAFKMSGRTARVFGGYRYLHLDYEKEGLEIDLTVKGPLVGMGIEF